MTTQMLLDDVMKGLVGKEAWLPLIHAFDNTGSDIFVRVTRNPDYYLSHAEKQLIKHNIREICEVIGEKSIFIEYGSGLCEKSLPFLDHLKNPVAFVALDIDEKILDDAKVILSRDYPNIRFIPLVNEFFDHYKFPEDLEQENRRVYYMSGSNIGLYDEEGVLKFFKHISSIMGKNGYFICTFDFRKPKEVMEKAYNIPESEELVRNVLTRMNKELGSDAKIKEFTYKVELSEMSPAMNFTLTAKSDQVIKVKGKDFKIPKGEAIYFHVFKFEVETMDEFAKKAGLNITGRWTDPKNLMMVIGMEKRIEA